MSVSLDNAADFCTNVLTVYPVTIAGKEVGSLLVFIALCYLLTCIVLIAMIKVQHYLAKNEVILSGQSMLNSLIFPVFLKLLWFNAIINILVGVSYLFFNYAIDDQNSLASILVFSSIWGVQHMLLEGVAFLLMRKGLGYNTAKYTFRWALAWGLTTFVIEAGINSQLNVFSLALDLVWEFSILIFYFILWVTPQRHLFRRPAAIMYAKFWFFFRLVTVTARILSYNDYTKPAGSCTYVFGSLIVFAVFEPLVLYYTLLQDSR